MIKKMAVAWADYMTEHGAPAEKKAVFVYGLECVLNELTSDVILLILALFLGRVWEMAVWIVVFNLFRLNVGGYHAKTSELCILQSTVLGILCVCLYPLIHGNQLVIVGISVLCMGLIFLIAPVVNKNKRSVTEERCRQSKRLARIFSVIAVCLCVLLTFLGWTEVAAMISVSVLSVCFLGAMGLVMH